MRPWGSVQAEAMGQQGTRATPDCPCGFRPGLPSAREGKGPLSMGGWKNGARRKANGALLGRELWMVASAGCLWRARVLKPPSLLNLPSQQEGPLVYALLHLSAHDSPTCTWWRQHHSELRRKSVTLHRWWKSSRLGCREGRGQVSVAG